MSQDIGQGFWLFLPPVILFGMLLGSFATALIYRIPRDLPWAFPRKRGEAMPRSACPHCGYTLRARDLVPLFSWLWLRGCCSQCRAPIGILYPVVELSVALGCVVVYGVYGLSASSTLIILAVPLLVALTVIDLQHYILPDSLNIMLAVLGLLTLIIPLAAGYSSVETFALAVLAHAVSALLYAVLIWLTGKVMQKILRKEALGFGDVKFFGVAGLWLGAGLLPYFLMLSGVAGIVIGLIYKIFLRRVYFPFGPALIAAFYTLIIFKGVEMADKTPVLYLPFSFLR